MKKNCKNNNLKIIYNNMNKILLSLNNIFQKMIVNINFQLIIFLIKPKSYHIYNLNKQ